MNPLIGYPLLLLFIVLVLAATWITAMDYASKKQVHPQTQAIRVPQHRTRVVVELPKVPTQLVPVPTRELPTINYPAPRTSRRSSAKPAIPMKRWLRDNGVGLPYKMVQLPVSTGNDSGYGAPHGDDNTDGEFIHDRGRRTT